MSEELTEPKMKKNKNGKSKKNIFKLIILGFLIVILLCVIVYIVWVLSEDNNKKTQNTNETKSSSIKCNMSVEEAEKLVGKAPYAPIIKVPINGKHLLNQPICQWYIDSNYSHNSYPMGDNCIFEEKELLLGGDYKISLKINNSDSLVSATKSFSVEEGKQLTNSKMFIKDAEKSANLITCIGTSMVTVDSEVGKKSIVPADITSGEEGNSGGELVGE